MKPHKIKQRKHGTFPTQDQIGSNHGTICFISYLSSMFLVNPITTPKSHIKVARPFHFFPFWGGRGWGQLSPRTSDCNKFSGKGNYCSRGYLPFVQLLCLATIHRGIYVGWRYLFYIFQQGNKFHRIYINIFGHS